jgi:hypothetical protein
VQRFGEVAQERVELPLRRRARARHDRLERVLEGGELAVVEERDGVAEAFVHGYRTVGVITAPSEMIARMGH